MLFLLQFHLNALAQCRAELLQLGSMILPALSHFILLVEADRRETLSNLRTIAVRTEDTENCSFTTRHSEGIVWILVPKASRLPMNKEYSINGLKT